MRRATLGGNSGLVNLSRGLAACLAISLLSAPAAFAGMREGVEAYKQGDYSGALREWLPLAEQGNPNALYNVAQLYRTGRGVPKDIQLAEKFYREAAERGHVAAQGNLGTLYYFAFSDSPRVKPALEWWEKAARNGDGRSQYMLGVMFYNGSQVARDPVRAYAWMRLANESGVPEAAKAEQQMVQTLSVQNITDGYALAQQLAPERKLDPAPPAMGNGISLAEAQATTPQRALEVKPMERSAPQQPTPVKPAARKPVAKVEPKSAPKPKLVRKPEEKSERAAVSGITGGSGSFYVQVSASGSEPEANALRTRIQQKGWLNGGGVRVSPSIRDNGATMYRVQVGPYPTRQDANGQCSLLKAQRQNCFVVSN